MRYYLVNGIYNCLLYRNSDDVGLSANINEQVDAIMDNIGEFFASVGLDPLNLPELTEGFSAVSLKKIISFNLFKILILKSLDEKYLLFVIHYNCPLNAEYVLFSLRFLGFI